MNRRFTLRAAAALAGGAALAIAAPLAASAHVLISPNTASPGDDDAVFTFKVPTESATASTVGVTVQLPTGTPFTAVSYQSIPGWTAAVTDSTLPKPVKIDGSEVTDAPTAVTFTATGGGIAPGQFQYFSLGLGLIPDTGKIMMPVTQSYSDGTVVKWDQPTPASGVEPEHPAPTLYITDTPPAGDSDAATAGPAPAPAAASDHGLDTAALAVGFGGLVLGAAGLVTAAVALTRRRRS